MSDDYSPAVALMATQMEAKTKIREQWKLDGGDLIDAHQFAFSSVASMIGRFSGRKFPEQVRAVEGRMSLTAQFIQGVDVCEASIAEGLYSQAAALLKQELETLAAVDEYEHERVFLQLFDEGLSKDEQKWLSLAMTILLHEEVIKLAPDALERFSTREADPTS